jgi:hypothetical protein
LVAVARRILDIVALVTLCCCLSAKIRRLMLVSVSTYSICCTVELGFIFFFYSGIFNMQLQGIIYVYGTFYLVIIKGIVSRDFVVWKNGV